MLYSRCASPSLAYLKAKEIVDDYTKGKNKIKQIEFENAKSSLTSALLSKWESKSGALGDTFQSWMYLQDQSCYSSSSSSSSLSSSSSSSNITTALTYRLNLISRIEKVEIKDVLDALDRYLCPLFSMKNVCFSIATPNQQCEDVAVSFGMKNMVMGVGVTNAHVIYIYILKI
jgi:hypothetical protein